MKITIKYIPNILDKEGRKKKMFLPAGEHKSLKTWLKRSGFEYKGQRIILNGQRIDEKKIGRVYLKGGDEVIVTPYVKDPATIYGLFATAATWLGASVAVAEAVGTVAMIAYVGCMVASIGYSIYSAFQTPKTPNFGGTGEGMDDSPTFNWNGPQTSRGEAIGRPIPVVFGRHAYGGVVLNEYISTDGEKNYLNMLLCAGQGEIKSISNIKINGNPIANFSDVEITTRMGTYNQAVIPHFEDLHNSYPINVALLKNAAHTYTTINDDVEAFEITFSLPSGLYQQDPNTGGIGSWSVTYQVEYKLSSSGTWIDLGTTTISATSRSELRRIFRKEGLTAGQYDIRITRTSDDSSLSPLMNGDLVLAWIDEIQTDDLIYPNCALIGLRALATNQLSGSLNIVFEEEGSLVDVPDIRDGNDDPVGWEDYYWDPDTEQYKLFSDGSVLSWDGTTYVKAWSGNPVWCMKYLLLHERFGLGDIVNSANIPTSEYLAMSRKCECRVPDGQGGYEKKYRIDVALDSPVKALQLLFQLASIFDAFVFCSQDSVRITVDEDGDPVQLFGMGNTYPGTLEMSWKSIKEVYNVIDVQFIDKDADYVLDTISVPDDEALAVEPLRRNSLRSFTTKKSYVLRSGRRALKVARNINRMFSFKAGIDSIACSPGDLIGFSHDTPAIGYSGRIKSGSTTSTIVLDRDIIIESGKTYVLAVQFNDDDTIEERTITSAPGTMSTVTVSTAFSQAPAAYDRYALGENLIHYKKLRVVGFQLDQDYDVNIIASEVNPLVYDDTAVVIPQNNYSMLSLITPDVTNINLTEHLVKLGDGTIEVGIDVWFTKPLGTSTFVGVYDKAKIYLSDNNGLSWIFKGETNQSHFSIIGGIVDGVTYKVAVVSSSKFGKDKSLADSPTSTIIIAGKSAPPNNVTGFVARQSRDRMYFTWTGVSDVDLAGYEIRRGVSWASGELVATNIKQSYLISLNLRTGSAQSYWIKAIDTSGNLSETETEALITIDNIPFTNVIESYAEETAWAGTKTDLSVSGNNLICSTGKLTGTYLTPVRDVGFVATFKIGIDSVATVSGDSTWDQEPDDATWAQLPDTDRWSGLEAPGALSFEIKTSEDNSTWSAWEAWQPGDYKCRYFQLRMTMTRADVGQALECSQFDYFADLPDVDDFGTATVSTAADGIAVTFNKTYHQIPSVNVDILSGDGFLHKFSVVPSTTGFTVKLYDLSGTAKTGDIRWAAHGV
jgi:predicted phage tail protein